MALMTARAARRLADAPALIDEHGQCSWAELDARVNRLVRALRAAGLQPGERIALFAGNRRGVFELMAAAIHCGLFYVPINWHFSVDELAYVLADSGAVGVLTDSQFAATAAAALQRTPAAGAKLRACIVLAPDACPAGFTDYEALIAAQPDASEPADQQAGGPMFYTSGTTGRPKGVLKNQGVPQPIATLQPMADNLVANLQLPPDGSTLLCGPYYHSAQYAWAFQPLLAGLRVVMCQRFDAAHTLALIDQHRITNVHLVPTQFIRLLRLDDATRRAFGGASLVRVWHGAAPCSPQVKRDMIDWWGPCIHEYYGSTEGGIVSGIGAEEWLQRPASVGRATFQTEVRILRDDGSDAPAGEQGTIYMQSRSGARLQYHNDAAKTAAAHQGDALFTTGDIGWLDEQGYLFLTDRKIDMIISGGVNIYPAEIESVLTAHPAVQDVAVIGAPNAEFGEEVKAIVQPTPGHAADDALREALSAHCRAALAGYKVPKSIEFRSDMPRTETGKLQKRLLREAYWVGQERRI